MNKKVLLLILDGFGLGHPGEGNAIYKSGAKNIFKLMKKYPSTTIRTDGLAVGLPDGQMGNSEVGHLNLGAGKVVYQKLTVINKAVTSGELSKNPTLLKAIEQAKGKTLHIGGLASEGGVHSSLEHLYEIIRTAKNHDVENICIHVFLDGRDTPRKSGLEYVGQIEEKLKSIGAGRIATVCGRYYAMDRDNRWERTKLGYDLVADGKGEKFDNAADAVSASYDKDITDEFVKPCVIGDYKGLNEGDQFIFFNFRPDRARQLTRALTEQNFSEFERDRFVGIGYTCMAEYDSSFTLPIIFTEEMLAQKIEATLGSVVSDAGMTQLRIAETENYAHVTYCLNGGREQQYEGEDRILVPSPKVATYDLKPEMSAPEVEEKLISAIEADKYNLIVCNFANCDMVGHTGIIPAIIKAVDQVDKSVKNVTDAAIKNNYNTIIIADHGNAEKNLDEDRLPYTAHTTNPVPCILIPTAENKVDYLPEGGGLADVAGLVLHLLGIKKPSGMKDSVLIKK
ncbi:MAG: 2,3-bisphosphoglycerate-independent phosphoglycerate mutase [Caldisericia bacterium]